MELLENTEEEIKDLVIDTIDNINNVKFNSEEKELQEEFVNIILSNRKDLKNIKIQSTFSKSFLKKNSWWLK